MAAPIVSAEARENLKAWLKKLQTPGLSQGDMAEIYSERAGKADYETTAGNHVTIQQQQWRIMSKTSSILVRFSMIILGIRV